MRRTIELIDTDGLIYYGRHIINTIAFDCVLPRDREASLNHIDKRIEKMDDEYLDSIPRRHAI